MDNKAVCFKCGEDKKDPLKLCPVCLAIPADPDDKLISMCMSKECIKSENLLKCSRYIKKKNRVPNFKERVIKKATDLLKLYGDDLDESMDYDFSTSFFNFKAEDLIQGEEREAALGPKVIKVNVIGRPKGMKEDVVSVALDQGRKTCHQDFWTVGKEISGEDFELNKDSDGDLYVRYRLMGSRWNREFISKAMFNQLKALEDGAF